MLIQVADAAAAAAVIIEIIIIVDFVYGINNAEGENNEAKQQSRVANSCR